MKDLPRGVARAHAAPISASRRPTTATAACRTCTGIGGCIGGSFQGYTIGNILSAQFHAAALAAHPEIAGEIAAGEFDTLRGWLGARLSPRPQVRARRAGAPRHRRADNIAPYLAYLRGKYGELYCLPNAAEVEV